MAFAFALIAQIELVTKPDDGYQAGPAWLNIPLVFVMTAPLAFRRIAPLTTACVMFGAVIVPSLFAAHTLLFWGGLLPLAVALYSLARHGRGWGSRFGWILAPITLAAYDIHMPQARSLSNTVFALGLFGIAWVLGWALKRYADQRVALASALQQLEAGQEERERSAVIAERSRIARELHDVVAHSVSVMVVQTGATRMRLPASAAVERDELIAVEEVGRRALVELRAMLGILRQPGELAGTAPAPGLAQLKTLVDQFARSGLTIELVVDESVLSLPAGLQLSVFRIVQEALTNVLKHAGPVAATVRIAPDDAALLIEISNEPGARLEGRPPLAGGHGLLGMRERAGMFGGSLIAGPDPNGGYSVHGFIPLETTPT
jgi:signal transduction histidine kinase